MKTAQTTAAVTPDSHITKTEAQYQTLAGSPELMEKTQMQAQMPVQKNMHILTTFAIQAPGC